MWREREIYGTGLVTRPIVWAWHALGEPRCPTEPEGGAMLRAFGEGYLKARLLAKQYTTGNHTVPGANGASKEQP